MRYIFDISDTGGKNVKLTWDLEGENLKDYLDFLVSEGQIEQYDNSDRESLKKYIKTVYRNRCLAYNKRRVRRPNDRAHAAIR